MPPLRRMLRSPRAWLFAIAFAAFAYGFHAVGNATGLYTRYWWFQIAAHYVSASALALLVARVGLALGLPWRRLVPFVVVVAGAGAVSWEVVEYLGLFENLHFWGVDDSLLDLAADAVGFATVLVLLWKTRVRDAVDPNAETPPPFSALPGGR